MQEEAYRQYILKTWPRGHLWQCRADLDGREVGEREVADDADSASTAMKAKLDARDATIADGRGKDGCPSTLEYAEAFQRVKMSPGQEAMLRAHFAADNHCLTASKLAEAAGQPSYEYANSHYGKLAQAIAIDLNYNPRLRKDGRPIWTTTIADDPDLINQSLKVARLQSGADGHDESDHFVWQLRPQVVEALKQLGF